MDLIVVLLMRRLFTQRLFVFVSLSRIDNECVGVIADLTAVRHN